MKKIFTVDQGTYPFDILVCIGVGHADIVKQLEKDGKKLDDDEKKFLWMDGEGRTVVLKSGKTVLRVREGINKNDFNATLAHEIFHAVEFLFARLEIKHSRETSETFAYQIQYLTGSIYEKLNNNKKICYP